MKKLIYIFLAAALLLTGCNGGKGDTGQNDVSSDTAVTTTVTETSDVTTENAADKTEAATSETESSVNNKEKQSEKAEQATVQPAESAAEQEEIKDTNTPPVTDLAEQPENDTASNGGVNVNPDGSIDLPIIPVN